jgi:hypothetical protein
MLLTKKLIFSFSTVLSTSILFGMQKNNNPRLKSVWVHNPLPYEVELQKSYLEDNATRLTLFLPKCYEPSNISFITKKEKESISILAPDHTPKYGKLIISNTTQELATIYALTDPATFHTQQKSSS